MQDVFESRGARELVAPDDEVILLQSSSEFLPIKLSEVKSYQYDRSADDDYVSSEADSNKEPSDMSCMGPSTFKDIQLSLSKQQEKNSTQMNFLPFVY